MIDLRIQRQDRQSYSKLEVAWKVSSQAMEHGNSAEQPRVKLRDGLEPDCYQFHPRLFPRSRISLLYRHNHGPTRDQAWGLLSILI